MQLHQNHLGRVMILLNQLATQVNLSGPGWPEAFIHMAVVHYITCYYTCWGAIPLLLSKHRQHLLLALV